MVGDIQKYSMSHRHSCYSGVKGRSLDREQHGEAVGRAGSASSACMLSRWSAEAAMFIGTGVLFGYLIDSALAVVEDW